MRISGDRRKCVFIVLVIFTTICLAFPAAVLGSSEGSGGGGVTVLPDASVLIQIVNFIFTIWVLNLLLYRPIRKIIIQRKEKVSGLELAIENSARDAEEKRQAFDAGIREARAKGVKEKEALVQAAEEEERRIIEEINRKAQAELASVREKIKKDAEAVREQLQKEVDSFAEQISQKILGRTV